MSVSGTDGAGNASKWINTGVLRVGISGNATLTIADGGEVSSASGLIGDSGSVNNTVTVSGTDGAGKPSKWTNTGVLTVGDLGAGALTIDGGGEVSNTSATIGNDSIAPGTVTVSGTDGAGNRSTWNSTGNLTVGNFGDATLNILNGGVVSSTDGIMSDESANAVSIVTIDGQGSAWTANGSLSVGVDGTATLHVQNDGLMSVVGPINISDKGTVNLDGGAIVADTIDNSEGGTFDFAAGSLTIDSGFTVGNDPLGVFPSSFTLDSDRRLTTTGNTTVSASRSLTLLGGSLTTNSLTIDGNLLFLGGTLQLSGGPVTGLSTLAIPTSGSLQATGVYNNLPISAASGSSVVATGNLTTGAHE